MKAPSYDLGMIGAGRMGFAIVSGLIARKRIKARRMIVADPSSAARRRAAKIGCVVTADAMAAASASKMILLAVKPQKIAEVAELIRSVIKGRPVISILAGATQKRLSSLLPGARIIRVMPNTPLQVGRGAIVIARDRVAPLDLRRAVRLFSPLGKVWVTAESLMNAVTAVSGSGPALYCAFQEAYARAGTDAGLPSDLSDDLARETLIGAALMLDRAPGLTPAALRAGVTSPGGTTEAALDIFRKKHLTALMTAAVRAAVRRGRQLDG